MMSQDSCYQVDDHAMHPTYSGDVEFQSDDATSLQSANTGPIGKLLFIFFCQREILIIENCIVVFNQLLLIYIFQK